MNIKAIIKSILSFIQNLFLRMPVDVKKAIELSVIITENLKNFVNSPVADALTALIPGNVDDNTKEWLRRALPQILIKLKLATSDDHTAITSAAEALNRMDLSVRSAHLHSLSILFAQAASDNKISWSDGVYLLEWYYKNKYKRNTV